ncbi:MAG: serine--tRNA ligase [Pseudomonadales bacterium]|nr:serine--tRNA ligase [Pseudomonadales bacterium]
MLDIKSLRQRPEAVAKALERRGFVFDLDTFQVLEEERKRLQSETETLQSERNKVSKTIGKAKEEGEDISTLVGEIGDLGERLEDAKTALDHVQERARDFLLRIPNIPDPSVPNGSTEEDNVEIRAWGTQPTFDFSPEDHVTLGGSMLDLAAAARMTGSRFAVLRGPLARLQRALTQFMLDTHINEHGYEEIYVPYMVNRQSLEATGQLPKFEEDLFSVGGDSDYFLIPTAEVPVTNMVSDQILDQERLPLKMVSHTPCFRSEAGSYGRDTRGIIRQHQFEKVELVQVVEPESSWNALEELVSHAEAILRKLELPYRVVSLCSGDLGFAAAKTYDLEVWLPSQGAYREISSCSNFLDFQARRAKARFRRGAKERPELVHTLNGSGLAVGRTLVAILENYQGIDGEVTIPEALIPYVDGTETLEQRA